MKIESIQHLRAFAALYVVLFHAGEVFPTQIFAHGNTGVSLFFAISGYIIAHVHGGDQGVSDFSIYAVKRIFRIFPAYLPALLLILILFVLSGAGSEMQRDPVNIFKNVFLIQAPSESILAVAWTLVFEMYFYLVFGLFYILLKLRASILLLLLLFPVAMSWKLGSSCPADHVWCSRAIILFAGGAYIGFQMRGRKWVKVRWLYTPFLLAFLVAPFLNAPWYVHYITIFGCLWAAVLSESNSVVLKYLGDASYSLYLFHIICISVLKHIIETTTFLDFALLFVITVIFSLAYYELVEKRLSGHLQPVSEKLQSILRN